jgi:hypothetical protein
MSRDTAPLSQSLHSLLAKISIRMTETESRWIEEQRTDAPDFEPFGFFLPREVVDSRILAALLSPNAMHGQGCTFLKLFLDKISLNTATVDLSKTTVECEVPICYGCSERQIVPASHLQPGCLRRGLSSG